jgi:hypothetical protein
LAFVQDSFGFLALDVSANEHKTFEVIRYAPTTPFDFHRRICVNHSSSSSPQKRSTQEESCAM